MLFWDSFLIFFCISRDINPSLLQCIDIMYAIGAIVILEQSLWWDWLSWHCMKCTFIESSFSHFALCLKGQTFIAYYCYYHYILFIVVVLLLTSYCSWFVITTGQKYTQQRSKMIEIIDRYSILNNILCLCYD